MLTRRGLEELRQAPINPPARAGLAELAGLAANRSA
jgi:geranylgeranyl diphosphate synthase type I